MSDVPTGNTNYFEYRAFLQQAFLICDLDGDTVPNIQNVGPFVAAAVKMGLQSFGEYQFSKILCLLVAFHNTGNDQYPIC